MGDPRDRVRKLAADSLDRGDPTGWFEALYREARGDAGTIPWADRRPHPLVVEWLERAALPPGGRALVIGCGLGDDAVDLARRGFAVTAFDVSETAVAWCRTRFPDASVTWVAADLFAAPGAWARAFDLVLEVYTIQALPLALRARAIAAVADLVAPGGTCLVVARGRADDAAPGPDPPWPVSRRELAELEAAGLVAASVEDVPEEGMLPRLRAAYRRPAR